MNIMRVGDITTVKDAAAAVGYSANNPNVRKALNQLVKEGYLDKISLTIFHPHAKTHIYKRTGRGFTITANFEQFALDFMKGFTDNDN